MTLLDRFRTQPRQTHPDPAVRTAFVQEIPLEDLETIAAIAREDSDPRVRHAAVGKLMDPQVLAPIAASDADSSVRDHATAMLRDIALEEFESVGELESLAAVDALSHDLRALVHIAKHSEREKVGLRALSLVHDQRAIASIARHAPVEGVRRAAFERSADDPDERMTIALNSEYGDVAAAAVERMSGRAELEHVVARAKNKQAVKRARSLIRALDEDAAREAAEEAVARAALVSDVAEGLMTHATIDASTDTTHDASIDAITAGTLPRALVAEDDVSALAEESTTEAPPLMPLAAATAEADVPLDSVTHESTGRDVERRLARLQELADQAPAAAAAPELSAARKAFALIRREWSDLAAGIEIDPALAAAYESAGAQLSAREAAVRESETRTRQEALIRTQQFLGRIDGLIGRTDLRLKVASRALRDVRAALGALPVLPTKSDHDEVVRRLKATQAALTPKVQELRETEAWQQWANVGIQEQLCAQMEELKTVDDPDRLAREIRELQLQWKQAANVPHGRADALWKRFKAAHDEVWARREGFMAARGEEYQANLALKMALIERAEALTDSTDWVQTAETLKQLQSQWKAVGPVSRGRERATWERFRGACDKFFTRRHEDLARRKAMWAENLARKEALCVRAEVLAESSDWDAAATEIRGLQAQWKAVGPVKKNRSEAVWQRFRAACDRFFSRHAARHDSAREERIAAREALCAQLEALSAEDAVASDDAARDLLAAVRSLRSRWQQEVAGRSLDPDRARALHDRFNAALAAVQKRRPQAFDNTDLDPDANRKRMESLVARVEGLAHSITRPQTSGDTELSQSHRLAAMLKEALAANTIGGKAEDDGRLRAAVEQVHQAQTSWAQIGPVPDELRRALSGRFQRACRTVLESGAKSARSAH